MLAPVACAERCKAIAGVALIGPIAIFDHPRKNTLAIELDEDEDDDEICVNPH